MIQNTKQFSLGLFFGVCLLLFALWHFLGKPAVLTHRYGSEMHDFLVDYEHTVYSVESHHNPALLLEVAQDDTLAWLEKYRCPGCPSIPVVVNVYIENLIILEYSDTHAKVAARIEIAAVSVSPSSNEIQSQCRASAVEGTYSMIREDGKWKMVEGNSRADTWTPVEELRQKVCPSVKNKE